MLTGTATDTMTVTVSTQPSARAESSNARLSADVRYKLLAQAIDRHTEEVLAQAVSGGFQVSSANGSFPCQAMPGHASLQNYSCI